MIRAVAFDLWETLITNTPELFEWMGLPMVPDAFAASVMARLPRPTAWHRMRNAVWTPRTLQWNVAGGMAAVCAVLIAAILVRPLMTIPRRVPAPVVSAESSITPVRLVIMQPGARTVQVAGDFNGWNPAQTSLEQISDGAWAVTISLISVSAEIIVRQTFDGHGTGSSRSRALTSTNVEAHAGPSAWYRRVSLCRKPTSAMLVDLVP